MRFSTNLNNMIYVESKTRIYLTVNHKLLGDRNVLHYNKG